MSAPRTSLNRRDLLQIMAAAGAATAWTSAVRAEGEVAATLALVDTNVTLSRWPFRRLPLDEPEPLVARLKSLGVAEAWAGSFDGLFHRDVRSVNRRLAEACRQHPELRPFGSVNLELPDWEGDLQECFGPLKMPGVRLHPNYHGYALNDARVERLLQSAAAAGRLVQIAAAMEDVRTQHPLAPVEDIDLSPLPEMLSRVPGARVQILNHRLRPPLLEQLAAVPGLYFDTARVEGTDSVPALVRSVPRGRVLFGSHAPFLNPEAALIRTHESGLLSDGDLSAVLSGNARQLLRPDNG